MPKDGSITDGVKFLRHRQGTVSGTLTLLRVRGFRLECDTSLKLEICDEIIESTTQSLAYQRVVSNRAMRADIYSNRAIEEVTHAVGFSRA